MRLALVSALDNFSQQVDKLPLACDSSSKYARTQGLEWMATCARDETGLSGSKCTDAVGVGKLVMFEACRPQSKQVDDVALFPSHAKLERI